MDRNRPTYLALIIVTITLGLFSRSSFISEGFIRTYLGDVLWATMVYFIFCVIFPKWSPLKTALAAATFSLSIELSQLCQQDWLNHLRHTRLGALILGFSFLWSDLICYAVGILIPFFTELMIAKKCLVSDSQK